jgi:protein-tyrosine phosphatase
MRITTVCLGNICRSPMAEAVLRHELELAGVSGVIVESAGTSSWHMGDGAHPRTLATLRAHGLDLDHRSRQITSEWFDKDHPNRPDLVLAMDVDNLEMLHIIAPTETHESIRLIRSYDPANAGLSIYLPAMSVPDPYYGDESDYAAVFEMLRVPCREIVAGL